MNKSNELLDALIKARNFIGTTQEYKTGQAEMPMNAVVSAIANAKPPRVLITLDAGLVDFHCADATVEVHLFDEDTGGEPELRELSGIPMSRAEFDAELAERQNDAGGAR